MQPVVETLSGLERRVDLAVPLADIEKQVQAQLKRVARTAKVQGFRPGKAPLSMIEPRHGTGIRYDVINTYEGRALNMGIQDDDLRLAGMATIDQQTQEVARGKQKTG